MNAWHESGFMPAPAHMGLHNGMYAQQPQSQPNSRLGPDAVSYLRDSFQRDPKPSTAYKRQLAAELRVELAKINNWFQNERAKAKNMHRQEEQRRLAGGDSPEDQDTIRPSSSNSSSPPIALSRPHGSSIRPPPLVFTPMPTSSTQRQFNALDLQLQPQALHYSGSNIPSGMVSAPAHITSFAHQLQPPPHLFPTWPDTPLASSETFPAETLQALSVETPTFVTVPGSAGWLAPADLTWPSPSFHNGPPSSTGFEEFGSMMGFDAPLHSAQFDGGFFPAVQEEDAPFYTENHSWSSINLPQLSPSESHHEQSIVSESMPMTPSSFAPEPFQSADEFSEQLQFISTGIHRDVSSASPAMYESLSPIDHIQMQPRPASTQPSSFTRKRDIKIPHLSIENSAMIMGSGKLRPPQSAGLRAPRSPLHPIRDDSRRVSKVSSHTRPSVPNTPC